MIKDENTFDKYMTIYENFHCFYIPQILLDSVYRKDGNYYPKVVLEKIYS